MDDPERDGLLTTHGNGTSYTQVSIGLLEVCLTQTNASEGGNNVGILHLTSNNCGPFEGRGR